MKPIRIAGIALLLSLAIVSCIYFITSGSPKREWILAGGENGGRYDDVARTLAAELAQGKGWKVRVEGSSGSLQNLSLLGEGKADLCLVQNDVSGDENIRCIATLYEEALHVIVPAEVESAADLDGKALSLGPAGGGTEGLAMALLGQMGLKDLGRNWRNESLEDGLQALRSGEVKGLCIVTGVGNPTIGAFLSEGGFKLLGLGQAPSESVRLSYPFVLPSIIPAGAYPTGPGKAEPTKKLPTLGTKVLLACRADLDEVDAFELTRFLHQRQGVLIRSQPILAQMGHPKESHHLQFAIHEGSKLHYDSDEPGFIEKWAETIGLVLSILAIAWGAASTLRQIYLMRMKESLDEYFAKVEAITSELVEGTTTKRMNEIARELHEIRRETTRKLIAEELSADESFVIFQRQLHTAQQMVNQVRENDSGSKAKK